MVALTPCPTLRLMKGTWSAVASATDLNRPTTTGAARLMDARILRVQWRSPWFSGTGRWSSLSAAAFCKMLVTEALALATASAVLRWRSLR